MKVSCNILLSMSYCLNYKMQFKGREKINMVNYRLIALDLDDTLLTKDKQVSTENKRWISKAVAAGVEVVFATGRGLERVEDIRQTLNLNTSMVLLNGAEVWKKPDELLERHYIGKENIKMLYSLAKESGAKFWGYSGKSITRGRDWSEDMLKKDWLKFGMRHQDQAVMDDVRSKLQANDTLEVTSSSSSNVEISQKGISKETGIQRICEEKNIKMNQVMAVGDNLNDLRLIKSAGLGVAMGNADPRLKEVADEITVTNEQDGVAKAIQHYIFNEKVIAKNTEKTTVV